MTDLFFKRFAVATYKNTIITITFTIYIHICMCVYIETWQMCLIETNITNALSSAKAGDTFVYF